MTAAAMRLVKGDGHNLFDRRRSNPADQRDHCHLETPADTLRQLATRVRRLSLAGRLGTEASYIERDDVTRQLVRLAADLEP
jgi:hypothetical protein